VSPVFAGPRALQDKPAIVTYRVDSGRPPVIRVTRGRGRRRRAPGRRRAGPQRSSDLVLVLNLAQDDLGGGLPASPGHERAMLIQINAAAMEVAHLGQERGRGFPAGMIRPGNEA